MWACDRSYDKRVGKYHWFAEKSNDGWSMVLSLCKGSALNKDWVANTEIATPRHADRCKRCVAALKRREKDEDAKG